MVKKIIILLVLYFFCSFTLLVCGKRIFCQGAGAGCFWPLGAGAAWRKNQEPEPEPEPLEKKVRSWSRSCSKICRLPTPDHKGMLYLDAWTLCES